MRWHSLFPAISIVLSLYFSDSFKHIKNYPYSILMERTIKLLAAFFLFAIIIAIGIVSTLPKDRLTFEEELQLRSSVKSLNSDLPRQIGSIGMLDSITYNNRSYCYYISIFGESSVIDFYRSHYDDFHDVFLYSFASMDGQRGNATLLAEYSSAKKIRTKTTIAFPNKETITWDYSPSDMLDFINSYNGTPTKALGTVLDFQVDLANYNLSNITTNSISALSEEGVMFLSFEYIDDAIIWNYGVDENQYDLGTLNANAQLDESAEWLVRDMITDPDIQELINSISISHSSVILRYKGLSSNCSVDFVLPYDLIKRYSKVPNLQ